VIVLAIDTATPSVTAGVVRLDRAAPPEALAVRTTVDARAHGELLSPHVRDALADAGLGIDRVDAVVCGTGPGPFTGLRVGMVTAASLGHALGRPAHGVCTLDAIAHDAITHGGPLAVVTDARRREVYWAVYDAAGHRVTGPDVLTPAAVAERLPEFGVTAVAGEAAIKYADVLGLPVIAPEYPSPTGLVAVVAAAVLAGATPDEFRPLYLRRPDAVEPGARKQVTAGANPGQAVRT
jgi:tRNA threonylcarbamoyl adenosine modification protein YeaZ